METNTAVYLWNLAYGLIIMIGLITALIDSMNQLGQISKQSNKTEMQTILKYIVILTCCGIGVIKEFISLVFML